MSESSPENAPIDVQITRLPHGEGVELPGYQSEHAAGLDLHAAVGEAVVIEPGAMALVPCGFAMAIPVGYEAEVRPRSGLAVKHGISMPNAPGTIDADYRGEVCVPLINLGRAAFTVERHMRVAQMLLKRVERLRWREVEALSETVRGEGGFGHTGR